MFKGELFKADYLFFTGQSHYLKGLSFNAYLLKVSFKD